MAQIQVYDAEDGRPCGLLDIPNDVIEAAAKVEAYLMSQSRSLIIHGVRLEFQFHEMMHNKTNT